MRLLSDGWVYDIPPDTEFIEASPTVTNARTVVECRDAEGNELEVESHPLSDIAPIPHWSRRLVA